MGVFCFYLLAQSSSVSAQQWKLEKHKGDLKIFSQLTDSGYKKVRVETIAEAHPLALVNLFNDVEFSSEWIHNCIAVKILNSNSPTERLVQTFFDAPWPIKNRDMVTYSVITLSENTVTIEVTDKGQQLERHPKFVRMQNMYGQWQAKSVENGKVKVSYTGGGNPGGKLPLFIANRELISSLFKTFENLKEVITLTRYQPKQITK
jgi:hypothetical protein